MQHAKGSQIVFLALAVLIGVVACATVPNGIGHPLPTTVSDPQPLAPMRPQLLIQFCDDDTGSYPHQYFGAAKRVIASSLEDAVSANQGGVTLYATAITSNTFDPRNTLTPALVIPAIPSYGPTPSPVPTFASQNPVYDGQTATAVYKQTAKGIATYNANGLGIQQAVKTAATQIARDVSRLTTWDPPIDASATSILGCLQLAANRLRGRPGVKLLYIASDMENNTDVDYTQTFVSSRALDGVIVHVIFFYSTNAQRDQEKRTMWCPYLHAAGAASIEFSDTAVSDSLKDVFDTDLITPRPQAC